MLGLIDRRLRCKADFVLHGYLDSEQVASSLVVAHPNSTHVQSDADCENTNDAVFAVHALAPKSETKSPLIIVFLLDRGGSMRDWEMDAARRGVCRLILSRPQTDSNSSCLTIETNH